MILAAAMLAAHASHDETGFRQRDLKFFFELCYVWATEFMHDEETAASNMHFARALKQFTASGFAKISSHGRTPRYLLTRAGLLECLHTVTAEASPSRIEETLFAAYFLKNYRATLEGLIKKSAAAFPASVATEIKALLDVSEYKRGVLRKLDRKIERLKAYTNRCIEASAKSKQMLARGAAAEEIVGFLQDFNPYQLNSQKPLKDLYPEIPSSIVSWELTEGARTRAAEIWKPLLDVLERYRKLIREI